MTDGFFSRPSLGKVLRGKIAPDPARIDATLTRGSGSTDWPRWCRCTPTTTTRWTPPSSPTDRSGARGQRVHGVRRAQAGPVRGAHPHRDARRADDVRRPSRWPLPESHHCPPDRCPGRDHPRPSATGATGAYRCGEAWSIPCRARWRRQRPRCRVLGTSPGARRTAPAGRRLPGCRPARPEPEGHIRHLLGRDRRGRRRQGRGADAPGTTSSARSTGTCGRCRTPATTSTSACGSGRARRRVWRDVRFPTVWRREDLSGRWS